tara:strand:+ start:446 stop:1261 length:816 start_codon:yes stop_codon:yes gene_type:complete
MSNQSVVVDDNKWVPTPTVMKRLAARGIDVEISASSAELFETLKMTIESAEIERGKVAVICYVLSSRSYTVPQIVKEIDNRYGEQMVRKLTAEGLVHLRCDEVNSVIEAVNDGGLTVAELEDVTTNSAPSKNSEQVRSAAIKKRFSANQVNEDETKAEATDQQVSAAIEEVTARTGMTVPAVVAQLSQDLGTKAKRRDTEPDGGTEVQTVEFYLKMAKKAAVTHAPQGYEMTAADLTAFAQFITKVLLSDEQRQNLFELIKNKVRALQPTK